MKKFLKVFGIIIGIIILASAALILIVGWKANSIMETEKSLQVATGGGLLSVGVQPPGNTVIISSVTVSEPGFIVIETTGSRVDEIIGASSLLPIGTQKNLPIKLNRNVIGVKLNGSLWKDDGDGIFNDKLDTWVTDKKNGLRVFQYFDVKTR
jgi:hypothetical protein